MAYGTEKIKVTKRSLRDKLIMAGLLGVAAFITVYACNSHLQGKKLKNLKNNLYNKVSLIANTNADELTDDKEWAKVYHFLDLQYDVHSSNPKKDLSIEQMQKYLERE